MSDDRSTIHHRRPRSIAGDRKSKRNRSDVPQNIHVEWHKLVDNRCATKIAELLTTMLRRGHIRVEAVLLDDPLHKFPCKEPDVACANDGCFGPFRERFANRQEYKRARWRRSKRRSRAWKHLRALIAKKKDYGNSLEDTFRYINSYLIDADYELFFWFEDPSAAAF